MLYQSAPFTYHTMKTKILRYSTQKLNQVVTHYAELENVCENVYTYLYQKDRYREEDDLFAVVLQIEKVYFQEGTYSRRNLSRLDLAERGTAFVANFHKNIEEIMQNGRLLPIMFVRIYEELGRDTALLLQYREDRKQRIKKQEEERMRQQELARQQSEALEKERLRTEKDKFIAGERISTEDFIALCKQEEIEIPLRTHGTLNRSILEISHTGIRYQKQRGKRAPKLDGCFALAKALKLKLE